MKNPPGNQEGRKYPCKSLERKSQREREGKDNLHNNTHCLKKFLFQTQNKSQHIDHSREKLPELFCKFLIFYLRVHRCLKQPILQLNLI